MGIRNKISPGYGYPLTLAVVEWADLFTGPVYKHLVVDSLNYLYSSAGDYAGEKGLVNIELI